MKAFLIPIAAALLPIAANAQSDDHDAAAGIETRAYYSTNPGEAVGKAASIEIDGKFDDWSDDMIIATCGANDICTAFHGSHENCVVDLYAVYAAWDDSNLYLAWQMCNTGDTWARPGDGPLTDGGRIGDVPIIVALSIDPSSKGMTGKLTDGRFIWGQATSGVQFTEHADHLLFMSAKPGLGDPAMFVAADDLGNTNYGNACKRFADLGIKYNMGHGFAPSHLWRQNTYAEWADATTLISDPSIINNIYDAANYDNLLEGTPEGLKPHDTDFDSFFEISVPLAALGINREWLENNGIGVRVIGTRGESGIDCCPFDPSMVDHVFEIYGKDDSTSHEKDDTDIITYRSASAGKMRTGNVTPLPDPDPNPGPGPDPDPNPGPDPQPDPDGNYVVYFNNSTTAWPTVYTWIWDAADNDRNYTGGAWPGATMTLDPASGYHKYSFTCTAEAPALKCIFNPGSDNGKSKDLELVNHGIYTQQGFTGSIYSSVTDDTLEAGRESYVTDGLSVTTTGPAALYTLQGIKVAEGTSLEAPVSGTYILRLQNTAFKLTLR